MKSLAELYTSELLREQNYLANWLPINPIEPGDIGDFVDNAFVKKGSLADCEVAFTIEESPIEADIDYASQGASSISTKLAGKILPVAQFLEAADLGFVVEFNKENAIILKTKNATVKRIKNQLALEPALLKLYKQNILKKGRVVISEIVYADSATILVSKSKDAKVEVKATAKLGNAAVDIADAGFNFTTTNKKNMELQYIAEKGLVIFYRVLGIKDSWFSQPQIVTKDGYRGDTDEAKFEQVDFNMNPIKPI
jgi:hypothetical protein